jgi:Immunoglobulin domain
MNPVRQLVASIAFAALLTSGSAQTFEAEPNNTTGQANLIFSGVSVSGQLITPTDVDIFSVVTLQAGALTIKFASGGSSNYGDYIISFLNAAGSLLAEYPRFRANGSVQSFGIPSAGTFYIRIVAEYYSSAQYALTATFDPLLPTITTQPADQNAITGSTTTFSVAASGVPQLFYQWRKGGVSIVGATSSSLRFLSTSDKDAGSYSVAITNTGGTAVSNSAVLTVLPASNAARLINLSVLTPILSGQPLTAGFVLSGSESKRVLIRAIGPTLSNFGVVNPVSDPTLILYDPRGVIIGSNDDWQSSNASTMASSGAFALPPGSRDAAIVLTLAPGAYTTAARGFGNASGMVLIEVYEAP